MGIYFTEYIVPPLSHLRYRPTAAEVTSLLSGLADLKWIDPGSKDVSVSTGTRATSRIPFRDAVRLAESKTTSGLLRADFPSLPQEYWWKDPIDRQGRSRRYELEEGDPFAPQFCETVCFAFVPDPLWIPADGRSLHCPTCRTWQTGDVDPLEVGELMPSRCANCFAALVPEHLSARTHSPIDGSPRDEAAPFFRFALILEPAAKAAAGAFPVRIDEHLMALLKRSTGLVFRNFSRWG